MQSIKVSTLKLKLEFQEPIPQIISKKKIWLSRHYHFNSSLLLIDWLFFNIQYYADVWLCQKLKMDDLAMAGSHISLHHCIHCWNDPFYLPIWCLTSFNCFLVNCYYRGKIYILSTILMAGMPFMIHLIKKFKIHKKLRVSFENSKSATLIRIIIKLFLKIHSVSWTKQTYHFIDTTNIALVHI